MVIELFGGFSPNVLKAVIALEELGLEYRHAKLDIIKLKFEPEFRKINPNSRIPAIVDQDGYNGRGFPLGESGAILFYLAEKHGAFLPVDPAYRYTRMQWLTLQRSGIGPRFGQDVYFSKRVKDQPHGLERHTNEVLRPYDVVERWLPESRYLGAVEYTIADMAAFPPLRYLLVTAPDRSVYHNMNRWMDEIAARPAVVKAIDKSGQFDLDNHEGAAKMTPDQWGRAFLRWKYSRPLPWCERGEGRRVVGRALGVTGSRHFRTNEALTRKDKSCSLLMTKKCWQL